MALEDVGAIPYRPDKVTKLYRGQAEGVAFLGWSVNIQGNPGANAHAFLTALGAWIGGAAVPQPTPEPEPAGGPLPAGTHAADLDDLAALLERDQKSVSSARTIHLDRRVVTVLTALKESQAEARRLGGPAWQDLDLVFTQPDGSWWNPPAISLAFGRAVKHAAVPRIRLHDLRHTHATLLLAAGINPKVVSERLGHSSVAFTLDTYAHVMPGMQPEAAALFMDLVYGEQADADEAGHETMEVAQ